MKKSLQIIGVYVAVLSAVLVLALGGNKAATSIAAYAPLKERQCIVIDAGHGGVDGGATSCTGVLESKINLDIAVKLNDLLHLLGIHTLMIRNDDRSVYTEGETIAAKKISDLKERVRIVNSAESAILVSIHQNQFTDSRYSGAQVFYAATTDSKNLANLLQNAFKTNLNPSSTRGIKKADSIYILEKINCTGVLIECGFLSNPEEEAQLRDNGYQQKICCVIASSLSTFLAST